MTKYKSLGSTILKVIQTIPTPSKREGIAPVEIGLDKDFEPLDAFEKEQLKRREAQKRTKTFEETEVIDEEESIDEVSNSTIGSYINRSATDKAKARSEMEAAIAKGASDEADKHEKKYVRRTQGISKAVKKLTNEAKTEQKKSETSADTAKRLHTSLKKAIKQNKAKLNRMVRLKEDYIGSVLNHDKYGQGIILDVNEDFVEVMFEKEIKQINIDEIALAN